MKKIYLPSLFCLLSVWASAQQEQMYTQFMFNKLAYNPGYAGSFVSPTLTAIHRSQWMGLEGAPNAQAVSYTQPLLRNRVGIGGTLSRASIGISRAITVDVAYAYRVQMRRGTFSVGLQASMRHLFQNWADARIVAIDQNDGSIPVDPQSKILPNFGAGVYYEGYKKWYVGFSVPRLVSNNIDFADVGSIFSREVQHINAMGGKTFDLTDEAQLTPQVLLRYAFGAPFDVEANVSLLLRKKFYGGLTYRAGGNTNGLGESVDALLGMQATENLFFCLSYDIGFTQLRKFNNGSVEVTARWWFNPPANGGEGTITPALPF